MRNFDVIKSRYQIELEREKQQHIREGNKLKSPSHAGQSYMKIKPDKPINHVGGKNG